MCRGFAAEAIQTLIKIDRALALSNPKSVMFVIHCLIDVLGPVHDYSPKKIDRELWHFRIQLVVLFTV